MSHLMELTPSPDPTPPRWHAVSACGATRSPPSSPAACCLARSSLSEPPVSTPDKHLSSAGAADLYRRPARYLRMSTYATIMTAILVQNSPIAGQLIQCGATISVSSVRSSLVS